MSEHISVISSQWLERAYDKLVDLTPITYASDNEHHMDAYIYVPGGKTSIYLYSAYNIPVAVREHDITFMLREVEHCVQAINEIIKTNPALRWNYDQATIQSMLDKEYYSHVPNQNSSEDAYFIERDDFDNMFALLKWANKKAKKVLDEIDLPCGYGNLLYNETELTVPSLHKALEVHDRCASDVLIKMRTKAMEVYNKMNPSHNITLEDFDSE